MKMFDYLYRVLIVAQDGGKDFVAFGSDKFDEADAAYEIAVANNPDRKVQLMNGARIMRDSERSD